MKGRFLMLVAFQVLAILLWSSYNEYVWATAQTFRIPLRPRDPFDLIRGRYFVLNPVDASIDSRSGHLSSQEFERLLGKAGWYAGKADVGFCSVGQSYRVCALARPGSAPREGPPQFWSRGYVVVHEKSGDGWKADVDLGLRRFFIPNRLQLPARENDQGWELEVSYRPGLSPLPRRLFFKGTPVDLK